MHLKTFAASAAYCVLLCAVFAGTAVAQSGGYPARPLRLVVPFAAGGPTDILARVIAQRLSERWGQQTVIDNRPGGGGNIGAELVVKAAPDGYTLILATQGILSVNPSLYRNLRFDPVRDFAPVSMAAAMANILIVHPSLEAKTVRELIQLAKAKPGQLLYASAGSGSASHLATEMFKSMAGVDIAHVPYKGAAPAVVDLLGGHVQVMLIGLPAGLPSARTGRLRALGVSSLQRSAAAPELPTLNESGFPGFEVVNWLGVLAPAGTPPAILDKLNAEVQAILRLPDTRERLLGQGFEPGGNTRAQFANYIKAELARWTKVVKDSGARAE